MVFRFVCSFSHTLRSVACSLPRVQCRFIPKGGPVCPLLSTEVACAAGGTSARAVSHHRWTRRGSIISVCLGTKVLCWMANGTSPAGRCAMQGELLWGNPSGLGCQQKRSLLFQRVCHSLTFQALLHLFVRAAVMSGPSLVGNCIGLQPIGPC